MPTPTQKCLKCSRLFSADFNQCPFCKHPVPERPRQQVKAIKCIHCGRLINPSFTECPFCKKEVSPTVAPSNPSIDYTAIAEAAVEHNMNLLVLDYSPASIRALDVFFDEMWGTEGYAPKDDNWTATQGQTAVIMNFGCYFGEVMRRRYGGRWQEESAGGGNPLMTTVALPANYNVYALAKVFKRLKNGSEDSLDPLFANVRATLGDQPEAGELEEWLKQARHLVKVKRPDHALIMYDRALQLPLSPGDHMMVSRERAQAEIAAGSMNETTGADQRQASVITGEQLFPIQPSDKSPPDFSSGIEVVRSALSLAGVLLNYSPASLAAIDVWMDYLVGREPLREEAMKKLKEHEWGIGCYLGELFCGKYGARWRPDAEHPDCSYVSWPSGFVTCPFVYPSKRMERGTEYGVYKQFLMCLSMLGERGEAPPPCDEADEWMKQAESFAKITGRRDLAVSFARKALQFRPSSAAIHSRIGDFIAEMKDQRANAVIWYDKALSLDLTLASAWLGKARLFHARNESTEAIACLERVYDQSSTDKSIHLLMGDLLKGIGRTDEAIAAYNRAVSRDEKYVPAWLGVASCLEMSGSLEQAVEVLGKIGTMPGSKAEIFFHKGEIEEKLELVNNAVSSYNTAIYYAGNDDRFKEKARARLDILENTPERMKARAEDLAGAGNMKEAVEVYKRILQMTPENAEAWGEAGTGLSLLGDIDSALAHFDKAISLDPTMVKNWDHKAVSLAREKRLPEALQVLEMGLSANPGDPQLLKRRGIFLSMSGNQEGAIKSFEQGLAADPGNYDIRLFRADVLRRVGRVEESLAELRDLCRIAPAWSGKSAKEARRLLWIVENPGKELRPDIAEQYSNRAWNRLMQGDLQGALADYDDALKADPFSGENWMNKGTTLNHLGKNEEALVCFDRALDLMGNMSLIMQNKAGTFWALGRLEEALGCHEAVLKFSPADDKSLRGKASALGALGRHEEALPAWDAYLGKKPGDADAMEKKAECLRNLKRFDEALAVCDEVIALDPRNMHHLIVKSLVLSDMGKSDEAFDLQSRAFSDEKFAKEWDEQGRKLIDLFGGGDNGPIQ